VRRAPCAAYDGREKPRWLPNRWWIGAQASADHSPFQQKTIRRLALSEQTLVGKKVAILIASGFEEREMTEPQRAVLKAGAKPFLISPDQGLVNGWHGAGWGHYFPIDKQIGEVLAVDYDLLVLPGGDRSVDKLAANPHTRRIVSSFMDADKGVAAFGRGVELLAVAARLKGRAVAVAPASVERIVQAGGAVSEDAMVIDRHLLTAQGHDAMEANLEAMVEMFATAIEQRRQAAA
jgi:protease I